MPRPWPVEDIKGGSAFRIQGSKDDPGRLPPLVSGRRVGTPVTAGTVANLRGRGKTFRHDVGSGERGATDQIDSALVNA